MIIIDGGLGRQLEAMGAPFRQPEWSALSLIEAPNLVRVAHDAFIDAGASVIATNSYALVPFHIGQDRFINDGETLLALSGKLARASADAALEPVQVMGSIPPMFGSYRPHLFDPIAGIKMMKLFCRALLPYVDIFAAETYSSIAEVRCFMDVFGATEKPIWLSVSLEDNRPVVGNPVLRSGERLLDLLSQIGLADGIATPDALLFNCSQPEVMEDAVRVAATQFESWAKKPLIGVYANAFPLADASYGGANADLYECRVDITPDVYADFAEKWVAAGAEIIGGCCGISPDHIRALKARVAPV